MEGKSRVKPLKFALIAAVSTFAGFGGIFIPLLLTSGLDYLGFGLILFGWFFTGGDAAVGLVESLLVGAIAYLIFKFFAPKEITKKQSAIFITLIIIVCLAIGIFSYMPVDRLVREIRDGKGKVWQIDTNGDKKIDKWVHDDVYEKVTQVDYDTNFDGKIDVKEYYKNDKIIRKEIITDLSNATGKPKI